MTSPDTGWSDDYVSSADPESDDYAYQCERQSNGSWIYARLAEDPEPVLNTDEDGYAARAWDGLDAPTPLSSRPTFSRQRDAREELRRETSRLIVQTGAYRTDGGRRLCACGPDYCPHVKKRRPTVTELTEVMLNVRRLDLPSASHHDIGLTSEQEELSVLMAQEDVVGHGRRRTGKVTRNGQRRIYEPLDQAAAIDFLLTGGYGIETHATGNTPGVPSSPAGSLWDRSSIVMRFKIVALVADGFAEWQQINGTTFAAGRGRRPRHEKVMLSVWVSRNHAYWGIPLSCLAGIVSRPYRTVADLAAHGAALASNASQPSRSGLAAGVGGDGLTPAAPSLEIDAARIYDSLPASPMTRSARTPMRSTS